MIDWFIQCPFPHVIHHTIPCHVMCVSSLHFLSSFHHVCVSMCVVSHPSYMSWYIMSWYGMVWYGMVLFHPMSYLVCHVMSCHVMCLFPWLYSIPCHVMKFMVLFHGFIQSLVMSWNSWFYSMILLYPMSIQCTTMSCVYSFHPMSSSICHTMSCHTMSWLIDSYSVHIHILSCHVHMPS